MVGLCPCPKDFWNTELKSNGLGYLVEEIPNQQKIQATAWLLLQLTLSYKRGKWFKHGIYPQKGSKAERFGKLLPWHCKELKKKKEKKKIKSSSGEEIKDMTQRSFSKEISTDRRNHQDNGRKALKIFQRSSRLPLPSQAQGPRKAEWFQGTGPGHLT